VQVSRETVCALQELAEAREPGARDVRDQKVAHGGVVSQQHAAPDDQQATHQPHVIIMPRPAVGRH